MKKIYLDHSATTPVDEIVLKKMLPYFSKTYGNASSIHSFGQEALAGVDKARQEVADFLHCSREEVIFTSGATESDNLAIKGFLIARKKEAKKNLHIITSLVEHDAVLEPFMEQEAEGLEVDYIKVKSNGVVDLEDFSSKLRDNTSLVSIMYVNSEVGAVMPVREIGKIIKKHNEKRLRDWKKLSVGERGEKPLPCVFHVDATQAINFFSCNVEKNYIDMLSLSGHKIYGPKGVGILFKSRDVVIDALQKGGHQESNLRSGTMNTAGMVGLGAAIAQINTQSQAKNNSHMASLRDLLVEGITKNIPDVILNTDREFSTPAHAHFSFLGVEGEAILMHLDMAGIAVSTGSACASGSLKASHVLIAMGIKTEVAHNSIRFSLGKHNTRAEIKEVIAVLPSIIKKMRKMNPLYKK